MTNKAIAGAARIVRAVACLVAAVVAALADGHAFASSTDPLEAPIVAHPADPAGHQRRSAPRARTDPASIGNPLWAIPLETLSVTRDRPIFSPGRRPPPAAVAVEVPTSRAPSPPAEPDHPLLTLVGTIAGRSTGIGVFLDQSTQEVIRLRTGQDFGGWILHAVHGRETRFDKGDRAAIIALPRPDAPQTSSPDVSGSGGPADAATDVIERSRRTAAGPPARRDIR